MDWRVKALAQKLLWRLPGGVRLNARLSSACAGHDPQQELLRKHVPTFFRHWNLLHEARQKSDPPEATLEIGTGWDLDIALLMSLCGVKEITTADLFRHVRWDQVRRHLLLFEEIIPQISGNSGRNPEVVRAEWRRLLNAESLEELCTCGRIRYIAPVSADYHEIRDNSLDVCYTTAVFEHIHAEEIRRILEATRRKLRPGGLSSHIIDLKDHFAYFQPGLPYNHFLRFSEKRWEWWADNPMSYLNRMSPSDWRKVFQETGYDIVVFHADEEHTMQGIHAELLHEEQKHRSNEDLRIGEIHVIARRGL